MEHVKNFFSALFKGLLAIAAFSFFLVLTLVIISHLPLETVPIPRITSVGDFQRLLKAANSAQRIPLLSERIDSIEVDANFTPSVEFDENLNYFYYKLPEDKKMIYSQIYENSLDLNDNFFLCNTQFSETEVEEIWLAVMDDHPELFWVDGECTTLNLNGQTIGIKLAFNDLKDDFNLNKMKFESAANDILSKVDETLPDYDKAKKVHDVMASLIKYDNNAKYDQSAYSALVNGKSVCTGYAKTYQYLLQKLGIPCYYVNGWSLQPHAWNIIKLDDEYYNVDTTWDDSLSTFAFFCRTDDDFADTHEREELNIELPDCNGEIYHNKEPLPTIEIFS